jgi:hypothetical protein
MTLQSGSGEYHAIETYRRFLAFFAHTRAHREGQLRVEAVLKLPRVFARACFVRFCEALGRSESIKSRKILLCSIVYKISPSFYTASVEFSPRVGFIWQSKSLWPPQHLARHPLSTQLPAFGPNGQPVESSQLVRLRNAQRANRMPRWTKRCHSHTRRFS